MVNSDDAQAIKAQLQGVIERLDRMDVALDDLQGKADVWHKREAEGKMTNAEMVISFVRALQGLSLVARGLKWSSGVILAVAGAWAIIQGVLPK